MEYVMNHYWKVLSSELRLLTAHIESRQLGGVKYYTAQVRNDLSNINAAEMTEIYFNKLK